MRTALVAFATLLTVAVSTPAQAYCLQGPLERNYPNWEVMRFVPVWLHVSSMSQTTWIGLPIGEVEANLKAAIDAWWQEGQSNVRPVYQGRTTDPTAYYRVVVRETTLCTTYCPSTPEAVACTNSLKFQGHRWGATLWFEDSVACGHAWTNEPNQEPTQPTNIPIRRFFIHELGHALGLLHPDAGNVCTWGGSLDPELVSMMRSAPHNDNRLRKDDRDGLITMYGGLNRKVEVWTSNDMLSWSLKQTTNRNTASAPLTGGSSRSNQNFVGIPSSGVLAYASRDASSGWTDFWPNPSYPEGFTWQSVAAANGPDANHGIVAWTEFDEDNTLRLCSIGRIAVTTNFSTWTVKRAGPIDQDVCSPGPPTATYDPKQNLYIVFWDGAYWEGGAVQYVTYDMNGDIVHVGDSDQTKNPQYVGEERPSIHTPTIECGDDPGQFNCIIVWDNPSTGYGCLNFEHTYVDANGRLANNTRHQQCVVLERTPGVSYREQDSTSWGIAFKQWHNVYTLRKTLAGLTWTDLRTVKYDPTNGALAPTLGERWELQPPLVWGTSNYLYMARTE